MPDHEARLIHAATVAREAAWCPYSGFAVGAAVLLADGRTFSGCNVENASYGLSICAERSAVFAAVAAGMRPGNLAAIAVVTAADPPAAPCGACRQVIAEFASADCVVLCAGTGGAVRRFTAAELLPERFELP